MPFILQTITFIFFISFTIQSQQKDIIIRGVVVNAQTNEPISYVNIGIINTEIGTLSNHDGSFLLNIPASFKNQPLLFSSIGYEKKSIQISDINSAESLQISLEESILELDEVVVSSKGIKQQVKVLGNGRNLLLNGHLNVDSVHAGGAIALMIDKQQYPNLSFVHSASLYITRNLMPIFKIRMRIFAVDSTNNCLPGEDLLSEQIIQSSSIRKGWLDFPLNKTLEIEQDAFYLAFEWILDKDDRKYISNAYANYMDKYPERVYHDTTMIDGEEIVTRKIGRFIAGTAFGTTDSKSARLNFACYSRDNSFGTWDRLKSILSAKITLSNYPINSGSHP